MSLEELEATRTYILKNLLKGFLTPSPGPSASSILMAHQKGKMRFCVDYRKLNSVTKNRYPLPLIGELIDRISSASLYED